MIQSEKAGLTAGKFGHGHASRLANYNQVISFSSVSEGAKLLRTISDFLEESVIGSKCFQICFV